ncbi:MAG TPA: crossover junction endodeoxyribonuclease RuvC, partial [Anaerolineae bacterium]|nr:crossover junction endodeoxyribonuclease RuvC [Anaerolineae bacterium]
MIVLGIDPGTAITGYGFIREENGSLQVVAYGVITTPADWALPQR